MFGGATITLDIGPHSSLFYFDRLKLLAYYMALDNHVQFIFCCV